MFFDNYEKLCQRNGESPSTLAAKLNIGKGSYSQWKKGAKPQNPTLKKIADYFGITVADLMSGQIEKPDATNDIELSTDEIEMISMYRQLSLNQKAAFDSLLKSLEDKK